jgi:hypothetical protein
MTAPSPPEQDDAMNRTRLLTAVAPVLLCAALAAQSQAAARPTPILIELFTSEGCSSCPPADAFLKQLDQAQPIPGAEAIVLSEHVDYWNHDGWTDPYSSSALTNRQNSYVGALAEYSPYTPQLIVNGRTELHLANPAQVKDTLLKAARAEQIPVSIGKLGIDAASLTLRAHIDADGSASRHNADVWAVIALDHAESQVTRGENGGRRLEHAAVALDLIRVGKLEKGKPFSQDFSAKLKPGLDPNNLRLIVFVQEPGPGDVRGAALAELGPAIKAARPSPAAQSIPSAR